MAQIGIPASTTATAVASVGVAKLGWSLLDTAVSVSMRAQFAWSSASVLHGYSPSSVVVYLQVYSYIPLYPTSTGYNTLLCTFTAGYPKPYTIPGRVGRRCQNPEELRAAMMHSDGVIYGRSMYVLGPITQHNEDFTYLQQQV